MCLDPATKCFASIETSVGARNDGPRTLLALPYCVIPHHVRDSGVLLINPPAQQGRICSFEMLCHLMGVLSDKSCHATVRSRCIGRGSSSNNVNWQGRFLCANLGSVWDCVCPCCCCPMFSLVGIGSYSRLADPTPQKVCHSTQKAYPRGQKRLERFMDLRTLLNRVL